MRIITKRSIFSRHALLAIGTVLIAFSGLVMSSRAQAATTIPVAGEHLITIHDNGTTRGILTKASTLGQAFNESGIITDPHDLVEPSLSTVLVATSYEVNIYRARPIMIIDGAVHTRVMSAYETPQQIVAQAGITLHDEDTTSMNVSTDMVDEGVGITLTITRATPFTFVLYGTPTTVYTQKKTVGDFLKEKGVTMGPNDTLSLPMTAPIQSGMTLELWRNGTQTATQQQPIPYGIQQIQDGDQPIGYTQVQTPGVAGISLVTYQITMKNGQEVSRQQIQSIVTKQPVTEVEVVGAKVTNTFTGDFAAALARLRSCEAGGVYTRDSGNGYYGAYQYNVGTWGDYDGYTLPSDAPPAAQDQKAWLTYQARGWEPWPSCSASQGLQDIYR